MWLVRDRLHFPSQIVLLIVHSHEVPAKISASQTRFLVTPDWRLNCCQALFLGVAPSCAFFSTDLHSVAYFSDEFIDLNVYLIIFWPFLCSSCNLQSIWNSAFFLNPLFHYSVIFKFRQCSRVYAVVSSLRSCRKNKGLVRLPSAATFCSAFPCHETDCILHRFLSLVTLTLANIIQL